MKQAIAGSIFTLLLSFSVQAQLRDFQEINFKRADSIARCYPRHSLADLKSLSGKLTQSLSTDVEKFRAIYTWVCLNIENDPALYFQNRKNREKSTTDPTALKEWNKEFNTKAVKTLFEKRKTVCTGYAYLMQELSYHAGIVCKTIDGYGRTAASNTTNLTLPNHSWNAVKLLDKWYLCDPTWSSGVINKTSMTFIPRFDTAYFLPQPSLFVLNHYPLDTAWTLVSPLPSKEEFVNRPLIYIDAYHYNVQLQSPSTFKVLVKKGEKVTFQFSSTTGESIKKVSLMIEHNPTSDKAVTAAADNHTTKFSIDHTFKSRGEYDVHLLVNESPVATYTVWVK